jgi:hypothetical protein
MTISNNRRLRRLRVGGGYRTDDVHALLTEFELRVRQLKQAILHVRKLQEQLGAAQAEVAVYRAREIQITEAMAAAERRAQEIEASAQAQARAVIAGAEEQASKTRGRAHVEAEQIAGQIDDILRLKETTFGSVRAALQHLGHELERIERGEVVVAPAAPHSPAEPPVETPGAVPSGGANGGGPGDETVFARHVELDAGPFPDFPSLSAFERAIGGLPGVEDVYVRRFFDERATIELSLTQETPLLSAMRGSLPYGFDVERAGPAELRLELHATSAAH